MTRRDDLELPHGATAKVRENAVKQDRVRATNAIGHHPERSGFLRRTEFIGGTADIVAFQEVENAAAARRVFPASDWHVEQHSVASQAIVSGENLPLVGALLGHRRCRTTADYVHVADEHLVEAAESVGCAIAAMLRRDLYLTTQ